MAANDENNITFASMLKGTLYLNRNTLYEMTPPTGFLHRNKEKNELIMELSPILMNSAVSSVFVYGTPGTGKTGLILELLRELEKESQNQNVKLKTMYINCSENRTETVIIMEILQQLNPDKVYPRMGWTRAKSVSEFNAILNKYEGNILVVLDEVDYALKESGDDILYRLSRINNTVKPNISTIIISNDIKVSDYIKPRTQSTFGRVRVIFSPYRAEELQDIISARVKCAFKPGTISDAVVKKVSEIEASRGGDARRALELIDSCAKIAMAKGRDKITLDLVDEADIDLEKDTTIKTLMGLTKHQKILYLAMLKQKGKILNGTGIYKQYAEDCASFDEEPLSERSVRTFLVEFQELGLIESEVGWLKDLKKKSRKIVLNLEKAVRDKVRKIVRDSI